MFSYSRSCKSHQYNLSSDFDNCDEEKDQVNIYVFDNEKNVPNFKEDKPHYTNIHMENIPFISLASNKDKHLFPAILDVEINPFECHLFNKKTIIFVMYDIQKKMKFFAVLITITMVFFFN